jgi:hypothetical protein
MHLFIFKFEPSKTIDNFAKMKTKLFGLEGTNTH